MTCADAPGFALLMLAATRLEAIASEAVGRLEGDERDRGEALLRKAREMVVRANVAHDTEGN